MFARVAAFEGGDNDQLRELNEERMSSGRLELPAGVRRAMVLAGSGGESRLFITFFDSREAVAAAEQQFEHMGDEMPEDARGRRTSVEVYEVVWDHET